LTVPDGHEGHWDHSEIVVVLTRPHVTNRCQRRAPASFRIAARVCDPPTMRPEMIGLTPAANVTGPFSATLGR
jgi:hypothetical protein